MTFETKKWIFQRISTPVIIILFFWIIFNALKINNYDYETIIIFFKNYTNLFIFIVFILLLLGHTSIEVFHSINDYFSGTKNEIFIRLFISILYMIIVLSTLFFVFQLIYL